MHNRRRDIFRTSLSPAIAFGSLSADVDVLERRRASRRVPYSTDACHTQAAPEFELEAFLCFCSLLSHWAFAMIPEDEEASWGKATKLERDARIQANVCMWECKQERWNEGRENTLEARRTYGDSMSIWAFSNSRPICNFPTELDRKLKLVFTGASPVTRIS